MKKIRLQRLLFIAVLFPAALLWGELFVQILLPQNVDSILNIIQPDPIVGYIYQPNAKASESGREYEVSYSTNSLGLRDREYDLKEAGLFRVLLFGDSFSESHGLSLEQSLSKQIEFSLQRALDKRNVKIKVEVVNASFGGYSPYHYWKSYERWKTIIKPDLILIGFYIGNDFQCENENIRYTIENGEIVGWSFGENTPVSRSINLIRDTRKWLAQHSELYVLLRNFLYYNDILGFLTLKAKAQESTGQLKPYLVHEQEDIKLGREKCLGYLKRLKGEADSDGVPVALITIPVKFEIDPRYFEQIVKVQDLSSDTLNLDKPYKELANFCESVGISFFDPRSDMVKENAASSDLYFKYDGHWNAKGIKIAVQSAVNQWQVKQLAPFDRTSY